MADGDTDPSKLATVNNQYGSDVDDSATAIPEKPVEGIIDDQYPQGYRLVVLAGATAIAVFLIALDQVSTRI